MALRFTREYIEFRTLHEHSALIRFCHWLTFFRGDVLDIWLGIDSSIVSCTVFPGCRFSFCMVRIHQPKVSVQFSF
jgi:hypothetical protein